VQVEYVSEGKKSKNPVVTFHVEQYLLDPVTDKDKDVPQKVHRIFPARENYTVILVQQISHPSL